MLYATYSFGKCLYQENFSIRSTMLFKWDLTQLALDPGAGQTKSVICFPPDFLLGRNKERQQWKPDQRAGAKEREVTCPFCRECDVAFRLWIYIASCLSRPETDTSSEEFWKQTVFGRFPLPTRQFGISNICPLFLCKAELSSLAFITSQRRRSSTSVFFFPFKKSQQNLDMLEFLETSEVKVQQLQRS